LEEVTMSAGNESDLALFGGTPAVTGDLDAAGCWPIVSDWAKEKVKEVLDADGCGLREVGADGSKLRDVSPTVALENAFTEYTGAAHCLSMVNGTNAIRAALWALGVGEGDEVICPSYTFWSTTMPVVGLGAKVVFAEVDPETLNIDPEDFERRITEKTKAVIPVHMFGLPADLDALVSVCRERGIHMIEDCCLAPGALYRDRHVGNFGAFGCFSMQAGKGLPAGEGGLLISNHRELFEDAVACGHCLRLRQLREKWSVYRRTVLGGVKNRLNVISAIIGHGSLKQLDEHIALARSAVVSFQEGIRHLPGLAPRRIEPHMQPIYHYNIMLYDSAVTGVGFKRICEALTAEGLPARKISWPQHQEPYFAEIGWQPDDLPVTRATVDRALCLPRLHFADESLIQQCITAVAKVWDNLDQLTDD